MLRRPFQREVQAGGFGGICSLVPADDRSSRGSFDEICTDAATQSDWESPLSSTRSSF